MALTKVSTDGVKDDAITKTKIPANQIEASELADNAVDTNAIADQAVALSKLPHGTSSNDGKFLRANNGADPSFETVTSTTINNNADNRVITGSGSANTLNAESSVVIDSSGRLLVGTTTDNGFKFKVSDSGGFEFAFAPNDSGVNNLVNYNRSGSAYVPFQVSGSDLRFGSGGNTERMRIHSSGKVLIGTTTPAPYSTRLLTVGDTSFNDTALEIRSSSSTGRLYFTDSDSAGVGAYMGAIQYHHTDDSMKFETGGGTLRLRIDSDGLKFGSDTAAANALDDYEEGTFTPAFKATGSSNNANTSVQESRYIKIGGLVFVSFFIDMNAHGNSVDGYANITGLPFTSSGRHYPVTIGYYNSLLQNQTIFTGTVQPSSNLILLRHCTGACSSISGLDYSDAIGTSTEMIVSAVYSTV